jgi:UDP-N-acetylmuramoylalanine--D-glutamate ligase
MNRVQAGQTVLILGLGESGLACARWCARLGAQLRVVDTRAQPPQLEALRADVPHAAFECARIDAVSLDGVAAVVRSPGLSPAQLAPLKSLCERRGIAWLAELDLFTDALKSLQAERGYAARIVAVTGTNGKTTVTRLCGALAARAGRQVQVAGNIGPALLDALRDALDRGALPELWVLELSSFQLDGVQGFAPDAATVLNLTQDHLDWHGSMQHYAEAKARIFGATTHCIVNRQDEWSPRLPPAKAVVTSFGLDAPRLAGDWGLETADGLDWIVRAESDEPLRKRKAAPPQEVQLQRIMPADALRIRGRHNAANAMAALALLDALGLPLAPMLHGLREFRGEPHRVEHVACIGGVDYFDDSKGTNVGATVAALSGLQRRVVLIAGGLGKGQDFAPLAAPVAAHARAVLLIGEDAPAIAAALASTGVAVERSASLEAAVQRAAQLAQPGDAVLLSPACASFDMFRGYAHRAEVFVEAVRAIGLQAGQEVPT